MSVSDRYEALFQLAKSLHGVDAGKQLQYVVQKAGEFSGAQHGCIVTFNEKGEIATAQALRADSAKLVWEPLLQRGLPGFAVHSRRTIVLRDIANDPRWVRGDDVPQIGSAVALPFIDGDNVFGVLMLIHNSIDHFDEVLVALLEEVASIASTALPKSLAYESSRYTYRFREAPVPLFMADMSGTLIDVNLEAVKLTQHERETLIGKPVSKVFRTKTTLMDEESQIALKNGEDVDLRTVIERGEELIPVSVRARQIEMNGKPVIEMFLHNISGEVQMEQLRLDLAAMVYHDLRGPLQVISTSTQKLGQIFANHDNPLVLTLLQTGIRSTRQLRRMIDSLLDIQRLEQGNAIIDSQVYDLRVVLTDAIQLIQPLATDAGMRLKFDFASSLPNLEIDSDMITRVVTNLLENAIKYTPDGGEITLRARVNADETVTIGIKDSGPGIPADMRTKIFDKYSRVKYRNVPKGIGLGLAFCRLAVEAHGGTIRVESDGANGSEFVFTLPVKETAQMATAGE